MSLGRRWCFYPDRRNTPVFIMGDSYRYYMVEISFLARLGKGTTERYTRDGTWFPYEDRWDVITNGVQPDENEDPVKVARQLLDDT